MDFCSSPTCKALNVPGSDTLPYRVGGVGSVRTHQRTDEWRSPPGLSLPSTPGSMRSG